MMKKNDRFIITIWNSLRRADRHSLDRCAISVYNKSARRNSNETKRFG